jgi:hypothetical protein
VIDRLAGKDNALKGLVKVCEKKIFLTNLDKLSECITFTLANQSTN